MMQTETNQQEQLIPGMNYTECYAHVFLGDCLEIYKNIEPKSIALILTDLPYGTTACKWDTIIPFDKLWEMINYLLKPNGAFITTASQPFTSALVMSNPKMFKYEIIWNKTHGANFFNLKNQPFKTHENIIIFGNNITYNPIRESRTESSLKRYKKGVELKTPKGNPEHYGTDINDTYILQDDKHPSSIINISSKSVERNGIKHPTQKPVALFEYLLKTYSNEGMTIFDPCMGSGTTGIACKNTNRSFIGIEKDEAYFKMAEQRINARTLFS